jgi:dTDP-4-amino-4,6-dideoxygalactose transaminase
VPTSFGEDYVAHLCVLRSAHRKKIAETLAARGISTGIHYPIPDHHQLAAQETPSVHHSLPVTEKTCQEILTLPCFPEMTDAEVGQVAKAVRAAIA